MRGERSLVWSEGATMIGAAARPPSIAQRLLPVLRQERVQLRLETVAKLIGEEASGMEATRQPLADGV